MCTSPSHSTENSHGFFWLPEWAVPKHGLDRQLTEHIHRISRLLCCHFPSCAACCESCKVQTPRSLLHRHRSSRHSTRIFTTWSKSSTALTGDGWGVMYRPLLLSMAGQEQAAWQQAKSEISHSPPPPDLVVDATSSRLCQRSLLISRFRGRIVRSCAKSRVHQRRLLLHG